MPSPETSRAGAATPGRPRAGGRPEGDRLGAAQLARGGFQDSGRAARLLAEVLERIAAADGGAGAAADTDAADIGTDSAGQGHADQHDDTGTAPAPRAEVDVPGLVADLGAGADPDAALLLLVRLLDPRSTGADGTRCDEATLPVVASGGEPRRRLLTLLGGSVALGEGLLRHPEHVPDVAEGRAPEPWTVVEAVRGLTGRAGADALRVAYRRQLLRVATADLCSPDPVRLMPAVGGALADLAAAALEGASLLARAEVEDEESCALTVVAMGKTGGRELNYLSDVDVIFLAAPQAGAEEAEAVAVGARLASAVMRICGDATAEGTLWQVDAALRPEGKNGPLVRSLESHREYYQRWAKTWEFQALLKARVVAGDGELGQRWLTSSSRWCGTPRAGTTSSTRCSRCAAGWSSTCAVTRSTGRSSSARAACGTSSSACSCCSSCTAGRTRACARGRRWRRSPRSATGATSGERTRTRWTRHTGCCGAWSTGCSCTG